MVMQLFLAVTKQVHSGCQKKGSNGAFVDANPHAKTRTSKYTMEEWHTVTDDVELRMHPEKPVFIKNGRVPHEIELHEIPRQRRMELQPKLVAHRTKKPTGSTISWARRASRLCKVSSALSITAVTTRPRCRNAAGLSTRTGTALRKRSFDPGQ